MSYVICSSPLGEYGAQHTDYVLVPTNKCGLVIGKGGETIKQVGIIYMTYYLKCEP